VTISLPSASFVNGSMVTRLLAELQFGRVVLGQPAFDSDNVTELDQAHTERHEILADWAGVRSSGREALGGPRHQGSAARQQQLAHLAPLHRGTTAGPGRWPHRNRRTDCQSAAVLVRPGRNFGASAFCIERSSSDHPQSANR